MSQSITNISLVTAFSAGCCRSSRPACSRAMADRSDAPGMTRCWWSPLKLPFSLWSQTIRATGCYIVLWPITRRAAWWPWSVSA